MSRTLVLKRVVNSPNQIRKIRLFWVNSFDFIMFASVCELMGVGRESSIWMVRHFGFRLWLLWSHLASILPGFGWSANTIRYTLESHKIYTQKVKIKNKQKKTHFSVICLTMRMRRPLERCYVLFSFIDLGKTPFFVVVNQIEISDTFVCVCVRTLGFDP